MAFDIENFPTSESAKQMLESVTKGFYDKSYVGKWLFQVMGMEFDDARELFESLPEQFFPETATWGLMYHELKWGLPINEYLSYKDRRDLIYEKRDFVAPMTPYCMEDFLKKATGFDVCVSDIHDSGEYGYVPSHPNEFQVIFKGEGKLNIDAALKVLEKIRQSHTKFSFKEVVPNTLVGKNKEKVIFKKMNITIPVREQNILHHKEVFGFTVKEVTDTVNGYVVMRNNLWYMDGSILLDGSKLLNAKVEMEEL